MGLAACEKPTGEFGAVEKTNEDDALVKWDDARASTTIAQKGIATSADHESAKGMMIWII
jgi:hypothetical protein